MKKPRPVFTCECGEHSWVVLTRGMVSQFDTAFAEAFGLWNWAAYHNETDNKHKRGKRWRSLITINQVQIPLGIFATEEEAARAYDEAALKTHGEFASLNFPSTKRAA